MFIPPYDLIESVDSFFKAAGNSYATNNVDGVLLLTGRPVLIDESSLNSYYGKQQIYRVFAQRAGSSNPKLIAMRILHAYRNLLKSGDCAAQAVVDPHHERCGT